MAIHSWSLYNCINIEFNIDNKTFIKHSGSWFEVDNNYVEKVNKFISNIPNSEVVLPPFLEEYTTQECYNKIVAEIGEDIVCMDRKFVYIENSKFEFCDLLSKDKYIIHVKPWTRSATISHLFSQGRVSADIVFSDESITQQINDSIKEAGGMEAYFINQNDNNLQYKIVFAIIYEWNKTMAERLPFFSK